MWCLRWVEGGYRARAAPNGLPACHASCHLRVYYRHNAVFSAGPSPLPCDSDPTNKAYCMLQEGTLAGFYPLPAQATSPADLFVRLTTLKPYTAQATSPRAWAA